MTPSLRIKILKIDKFGDYFSASADTLCPSEAPGVILINYKGDNISKYVCLTAKIDITRKIIKFVNF